MYSDETKLRITIDIFSGRENPTIEYSGKHLDEICERLSLKRSFRTRELGLPPIPTLGYRGLMIEQHGTLSIKELPRAFRLASGAAFGLEMSYQIADEDFEDFVCGSVPKELPINDLRKEIAQYKELVDFWNQYRWRNGIIKTIENKCKCAPIYEPDWWNVSSRQGYNNCYNYATNYRSNTYAQPGRASGAMYNNLNCVEVKAGAIADELIDSPSSDNKCPEVGHLVALVVWPNVDYHWYRKGKNGQWSHKMGGTPVTNLDNSGNTINDPRNADRGSYSDFCTFMIVKHGHIMIN